MLTVDPSRITLIWKCGAENSQSHTSTITSEQSLADIVSAGTAICEECGDDMELVSTGIDEDSDEDSDED